MPISRIFLGVAAALIMAATFMAAPGRADDITPSRMAAALEAVRSAKASKDYDNVLPILSERVQDSIIRLRPDLYKQISDVVRQEALKLVNRRADLDNDIARVWANAFTEDELKAITAFYKSPAGLKLADLGPQVVANSLQAVKGWSDKVGQELMQNSREELKKQGIEF
jgi:uncharacterized protein